MSLPARFEDAAHVENVMTAPDDALSRDLAGLDGDLLVLGAGGKMGPTLARLARNAAPDRRVLAVARFSKPGLREDLDSHGVETIAADVTAWIGEETAPSTPHAASTLCHPLRAARRRAMVRNWSASAVMRKPRARAARAGGRPAASRALSTATPDANIQASSSTSSPPAST